MNCSLKLVSKTCLSVLVVAAIAGIAPAAAANPQPWTVEGKLLGEVDGHEIEKAEDISGIACAPGGLPRLCLIVDDETQGAQIVLLNQDRLTAGEFIRLSEKQFKRKPLELDAEAVAADGDHFYVVGSHGRARKDDDDAADERKNIAKAEASRFIYRIALKTSQVDMTSGRLRDKPAISTATLTPLLQRIPEIAAAHDKPLAKNGLTIEGLAAHDGKLYVGLRGPVIGTDAAVVSIDIAAVFDGAPAEPRLHRLKLDTDRSGLVRGVRDIVRHGDNFLVLAGPVNDPKGGKIGDGDYAIYRWDGVGQVGPHVDLASFGKKAKPEALLPLEGDARRARILLMFDGPREGAPTPIDVEFK